MSYEKKDADVNVMNVESASKVLIYDYLTVEVKEKTKQLVIDAYENLGWEEVSRGFCTINFRRNHCVNNKSELKKLQFEVEKVVNKIEKLEENKNSKGIVVSLSIGIIGALIMGTGMALVMEFNQMMFGILLGILGIIICLPAYPAYKKSVITSTNKVSPLIDDEYDKLMDLCSKATKLI